MFQKKYLLIASLTTAFDPRAQNFISDYRAQHFIRSPVRRIALVRLRGLASRRRINAREPCERPDAEQQHSQDEAHDGAHPFNLNHGRTTLFTTIPEGCGATTKTKAPCN